MKLIMLVIFFVWATPVFGLEYKKKDLIGVWTYVSAYTWFADGRKQEQFSDEPQGIFIIASNGYYAHIIMAKNLPKVKSGRFKEMTSEEAQIIAENELSHFGTWEAQEKEGKFTVRIKKSSFPNFDGVTQVRTITKLTKDELGYVNDLAVTAPGARAVALLRRLK